MDVKEPVTLKLTPEQIQVVMTALTEGPFKVVSPVINAIVEQLRVPEKKVDER